MATAIQFPSARRWDYLGKNGVTVSSYGIPREFQAAFVKILAATKENYQRLFGDHVIGFVEFNVRKSAQSELRMWTNGADRIYLTLSKKAQLERTPVSGVRNIHGLAHELAHIVVYRSLINLSCLPRGWGEGWAVYLASFHAVPYLYKRFGPNLWPYPFDYLRSDGPDHFLKSFAAAEVAAMHPTAQVVWQLNSLEHRVGHERFVKLIRSLLATPIRADEFVKEICGALRRNRLIVPRLR